MKRSVKKLTELELKKAAVKEDKDYNLSMAMDYTL